MTNKGSTGYLIVRFSNGELEKLGEHETEGGADEIAAQLLMPIDPGVVPVTGPIYVIRARKFSE
jgi:hypothetical protein